MKMIVSRVGQLAALALCCMVGSAAAERPGSVVIPDILFQSCGTLGIGPQGCTLFQADSGATFAVSDIGEFGPGDTVFISGFLPITPVSPCFPAQIPPLLVQSIGQCFDECGTLFAPPFCGAALMTDSGAAYLVDDLGGFRLGDHVRITGALVDKCVVVPECQLGSCVDVATIEPCAPSVFSSCGELVLKPGGCMIFVSDSGQSLVLDNPGEFLPGSHVFVSGTINDVVFVCSPSFTYPFLADNIITDCFESCGTIGIGPQGCPVFQADDGQGYFISDTGGFGPGDNVRVTGGVIDDFFCAPIITAPGIITGTIEPCVSTFSSFGTLVQGFECLMFESTDGQQFLIDPQPGFKAGDFVHVTATVDDSCFSFCFLPCLTEVTIQPAISSFGTIEFSVFGCLVFVPTGGGALIIGLPPGFQVGDFVHVTGAINSECISFCFLPCLEEVTIQHAFTGCGTLNQGFECLFFTADSDPGKLFSIFGVSGFAENAHVNLTGIIDEQCFSFCFVPCLFVDEIELTGGDLNCDGVVNTLDLGVLLSSWSIPPGVPGCGGSLPCPSDLNGDGFVNSLDLGMLLSDWTL